MNSLTDQGKKGLSGGRAGAVASKMSSSGAVLEERDDASPPLTLVDAAASAKVKVKIKVDPPDWTCVRKFTLESQDDICAVKKPPPMKPTAALQHGTNNAAARLGQLKQDDGPHGAHGPFATGKENPLPLLSGLKIHDGNHSPSQKNLTMKEKVKGDTLSDAIKSTTAPTASTSAAEKEGKARPKQQEPPTPVTSAAALAATTTPPTAVPSTAAASIVSEADTLLAEQAENQVASLMRKLNKEDEERVSEALRRPRDRSKNKEVVTQVGTDLVLRESIQRLRPKKWLNDEVIHIYFAMLGKHDEELCRLDPSRKPSHFFKSFLMTSLLNVAGTENGQYEYKNVKRWSKKVPGKDIFNLDKIVFPINQGQEHWGCAVIQMQKMRIQFYDSLGRFGETYLEALFQYLKDEHEDKKKCPLPDIDEWVLVPCTAETPRQDNDVDCGVFTCMFAYFLSMGYPLVFAQSHIAQCRKLIALSILNGKVAM